MDYAPPSSHGGKEDANAKDTCEGKIEVKIEGTLKHGEGNQAVVMVPPVDSSNSKVIDRSISTEKTGHGTGVTYMDVPISADDVMRAGGLGARDDMSSFLPVAIDSTDFEASLRDARDFEEPQIEISRPGLGWCEPADDE